MSKESLFLESKLLTPKEAAAWASHYVNKNVSVNNIMYLINYGKIASYTQDSIAHLESKRLQNLINLNELKAYYDTLLCNKAQLNHPLSFSQYKEAQTTKHIHRLHPYKGKFIPQLVEYFLDSHLDSIKTQNFFKSGDIVLDIFCGSGTTLCVASELGIHALGLEISSFNTLLSNAKIKNYDLYKLDSIIKNITQNLESFVASGNILAFENALNTALSEFNQQYFPNDFKRKVFLKQIDEKSYSEAKNKEFLSIYNALVRQFDINISTDLNGSFYDKWYLDSIKNEISFVKSQIYKAPQDLQDILKVMLSRTARSCRATTHADLATLKEPIVTSYYCAKHGRICKPLFSILKWWKSYTQDTLKRLAEFKKLKSDSMQICLNLDSTNDNILESLRAKNPAFATLIESKKIDGIFSSPPYLGLIDYHEQHAYAYDIFNFSRLDSKEIGSKKAGQGKVAKEKYIKDIAKALKNAKPLLKNDYDIFLVANDKFNLYPHIAHLAGMKIVKRYDRPVLNRSEKDINAYSESIFHLKDSKDSKE